MIKKAEDVENKVVVTEELPKAEPVHIPTPPPIIETPNHTTTPVPPVNNIEIPVQKTANTSDIAFTVEKKR